MDRFDGKCDAKVPIYFMDTKVILVNNRVTTMSTKIVIEKDFTHDFKVKFINSNCKAISSSRFS